MTRKFCKYSRWRLRHAATAALLAAITAGVVAIPASASGSSECGSAGATGSSACVILIEVNGLEPKDVTKTNTPFLWALAHSGDTSNDQVGSSFPALTGRNGWGWQAARGVMGTGNGPAAASLLTGGTAEQTGIPNDVFRGGDEKWYATGGLNRTADTCGDPTNPCDSSQALNASTVLYEAQQAGESVGMWIGDPALCSIANSGFGNGGATAIADWVGGGANGTDLTSSYSCPSLWQPAPSTSANQSPYCPPPVAWPAGSAPAACPAPDAQTLQNAATGLQSDYPQLSYIHLAEVGAVKQRSGENDCFSDGSSSLPAGGGSLPQVGCGSSPEPPAVSRALQSTDAALAAFAAQVAQSKPTAWQHTYLMVVGNHGYEATPTPLRVPDPNNLSASSPGGVSPSGAAQPGTGDLASYVNTASGGKAVAVPDGTMATIYYTGPSGAQAETNTLQSLYKLLDPKQADTTSNTNSVNNACAKLLASDQTAGTVPSVPTISPDCVQAVYYVDPTVLDPAAMQANGGFERSQFLFGQPGDPGYPTASNPFNLPYPEAHCQSSDSGAPQYDANCDPNLLSFHNDQQPTWHLNALQGPPNVATPTTFSSTGASGQLVVQLAPGWAAGPLASANTAQTTSGAGAIGTPTNPVDPYLASGGGPRDRAVAAIINGPGSGTSVPDTVTQYPDSGPGQAGDGLAPVTKSSPVPYPGTACSPAWLSSNAAYTDSPAAAAVDQANADPGNDGAAFGDPVWHSDSDSFVKTGHECQAQTIDFAPSIASLLQFQLTPQTQIADARLLSEAFKNPLVPYAPAEDLGTVQAPVVVVPPPPPPPPLPPPRVIIYIPPPPVKPYDFFGLIRNVQARTVDQRNDTVAQAPPGAYLSSIRITADFGKPLSEVTITLYRDAAPALTKSRRRGHTAQHRLTALARFCPFTVTRAPDVQLRFQVPRAYQPTYIGLAVRQALKLPRATGPGCGPAHHNAFAATGPLKGAIVPIIDGQLLHRFKPRRGSRHVPRGRR